MKKTKKPIAETDPEKLLRGDECLLIGSVGKRRYKAQKRAAFRLFEEPIDRLRLGMVDLPREAHCKLTQAFNLISEARDICRPWWGSRRPTR